MNQSDHQEGVSIHTGFPNPATDTSLRSLDLNQLLIQHSASTYLFRIRGNSWEGIGIFDNDIAIIDRSLDARNTDTVIWWSADAIDFSISSRKAVPPDAQVWGVVTATIHELRKINLPAKRHG